MSFEANLYLFHHVFLPPKLPQAADYDHEHERLLLDKVLTALGAFSDHVPAQDAGVVITVIAMLRRLRDISGLHGDGDEATLLRALELLAADGKHVRGRLLGIMSNLATGGILPFMSEGRTPPYS